MRLGDAVKTLTSALGIPQCDECKVRQEKLNAFSDMIAKLVRGESHDGSGRFQTGEPFGFGGDAVVGGAGERPETAPGTSESAGVRPCLPFAGDQPGEHDSVAKSDGGSDSESLEQ